MHKVKYAVMIIALPQLCQYFIFTYLQSCHHHFTSEIRHNLLHLALTQVHKIVKKKKKTVEKMLDDKNLSMKCILVLYAIRLPEIEVDHRHYYKDIFATALLQLWHEVARIIALLTLAVIHSYFYFHALLGTLISCKCYVIDNEVPNMSLEILIFFCKTNFKVS